MAHSGVIRETSVEAFHDAPDTSEEEAFVLGLAKDMGPEGITRAEAKEAALFHYKGTPMETADLGLRIHRVPSVLLEKGSLRVRRGPDGEIIKRKSSSAKKPGEVYFYSPPFTDLERNLYLQENADLAIEQAQARKRRLQAEEQRLRNGV
jgi:hypothetical protein